MEYNSALSGLAERLLRLPYTKRAQLASEGIASLKTIGNYLIALEKDGLLKSETIGKEKKYINYRLLELLKNT